MEQGFKDLFYVLGFKLCFLLWWMMFGKKNGFVSNEEMFGAEQDGEAIGLTTNFFLKKSVIQYIM